MLYREILEKFNTGDVILFRSNTLFDQFVDLFVERKYTDGGIIIKDPMNYKEGLYILRTIGYDTQSNHFNIILQDFKVVYDSIDGEHMYWRKLNCVRDHNFYNRLYTMFSVLVCKSNNNVDIHWILDQYNAHRGKCIEDNDWCCVCVYVFVSLALLPIYFDWSRGCPEMFNEGGLSLEEAILDKEIQII